MQLTLAQVGEKYRAIRERVYQLTNDRFAALGVHARQISDADATSADAWDDKYGVVTWKWCDFVQYARRDAKRFDLAIEAGDRLCALCLGVPTGGKMTLKLHVVGSNPHENPLKGKVLMIVFSAAHAYAAALGSLEVHLCEPVNERVIALYKTYGYETVQNKQGVVTHMRKLT